MAGEDARARTAGEVEPEFFASVQLRLSGAAGISIIHPTPHPMPLACYPHHTPVVNRTKLNGCAASACLKIDLYFGNSQEH